MPLQVKEGQKTEGRQTEEILAKKWLNYDKILIPLKK